MPAVRALLAAVALVCVLACPAVAQKQPKQDSITVVLSIPRDTALDATVAAFSAVGLAVSDQGAGFVEADMGELSGMHHQQAEGAIPEGLGEDAGRGGGAEPEQGGARRVANPC